VPSGDAGHLLHLQDDRVVDEHFHEHFLFLQRATASFNIPSVAWRS
jgi:hypothetical protein